MVRRPFALFDYHVYCIQAFHALLYISDRGHVTSRQGQPETGRFSDFHF